jgi:hypothetical protein
MITNGHSISRSSSLRPVATHELVHLVSSEIHTSKLVLHAFIGHHRVRATRQTPDISEHDGEVVITFDHSTNICIVLNELP